MSVQRMLEIKSLGRVTIVDLSNQSTNNNIDVLKICVGSKFGYQSKRVRLVDTSFWRAVVQVARRLRPTSLC